MAARVAVVGGGLAGLCAGVHLARGGASVTVFERSRAIGGRARTAELAGASVNLGAHALYRGGAAARILAELDVRYSGREPKLDNAFAVRGGQLHRLPRGLGSLVTTSLLPFRSKLEVAGLLAKLGRLDARALARTSTAGWLEATFATAPARELLAALFRLSTYANDPARTSAGASIAQLALASAAGVLYLDGGWQTLVEGLRARAIEAGVEVRSGSAVAAVEHDDAVRAVRLSSGERVAVDAAVIAASPEVAREVIAEGPAAAKVAAIAADAIPVEAAALDLVLDGLPRPGATFALGIDRPLYLSVHSRSARVAPEGRELVSLMKYLEPARAHETESDERELEELLDLVQPGWRERVIERRYLPRLQVAGTLPRADRGGVEGRPSGEIEGVRGLALAGDWIGPEGQLADAAIASGTRAAERILAESRVETSAAA